MSGASKDKGLHSYSSCPGRVVMNPDTNQEIFVLKELQVCFRVGADKWVIVMNQNKGLISFFIFLMPLLVQ